MCRPSGYGFWAVLVWKRVWNLLVGVVGVYERIYHVNSKCGEREIWEFQINFKKSFLLAF